MITTINFILSRPDDPVFKSGSSETAGIIGSSGNVSGYLNSESTIISINPQTLSDPIVSKDLTAKVPLAK